MPVSGIKKIGLMTSGGDSPGMNAAIRAIVRTALFHQIQPYGIMRGYQGMFEGDIKPLHTTEVANIIHRGGTILKTARSKDFRSEEGMKKAYEELVKHGLDALVLIGGDGTFRGAVEFFKRFSIPAIGLPGTIDNDLFGTDYTIGFDTAVNTAVEAIDRIRDTADAHERLFLIEVMGRDAGYIALNSGIAGGAAQIFIPEQKEGLDHILNELKNNKRRRKQTNIMVVAEGDESGGAMQIQKQIAAIIPDLETRVTILGHIQRGGNPSASDRVLATRLGYGAVMALMEGKTQCMAGMINNEVVFTPFESCVKTGKPMSVDMLKMIEVLSR